MDLLHSQSLSKYYFYPLLLLQSVASAAQVSFVFASHCENVPTAMATGKSMFAIKMFLQFIGSLASTTDVAVITWLPRNHHIMC